MEGVLQHYRRQADHLVQELNLMRTTVAADLPLENDVPLFVERLGDHTDDLISCGKEIRELACRGHEAAVAGGELAAVRRSLVESQACHRQLLAGVFRLVEPEAARERLRLRRKNAQWKSWVRTVEDSLARITAALCGLTQSLGESWEELSDRLGGSRVTAQATVSGSNFSTSAAQPPR